MDLVRQDQLFKKGIDEDGDIIGVYSEATEMMNPEKLQNIDTLYDTGEFYNSFVIFVGKQFFEIQADTLKMENENWWVQNNISKNAILGLTDENKINWLRKLKKDTSKKHECYLELMTFHCIILSNVKRANMNLYGKESGTHELDETRWMDIYDQYIREFGLGKLHSKLLEAMRKAILQCEYVEKRTNSR